MATEKVIDWCVAFNGGNTDVLSRMFFGLLAKHCGAEAQFHLVDNGDVAKCIDTKYAPADALRYTVQYDWKPSKQGGDYYAESATAPWTVAEWMIDNCGTHSWCILSHFDVIIKGDILSWTRKNIKDDVGIIGTHCPIMAINRAAYRLRRVGFAPSPSANLDIGVALENDLQSQGWKHCKFDEEANRCFHHMGGGGGYHNREEFESMRKRAIEIYDNKNSDCQGVTSVQPSQSARTTNAIHFISSITGLDTPDWRIACMPNMVEFHRTKYHLAYQRSDDPRAVNCPACKKTEAYRIAAERNREEKEENHPRKRSTGGAA